jgi:hypothetical protein
MLVCVTLEPASPVGVEGGVVSGQAAVVTLICVDGEVFPAAS